jgi:flagellar motor switch protein FliM
VLPIAQTGEEDEKPEESDDSGFIDTGDDDDFTSFGDDFTDEEEEEDSGESSADADDADAGTDAEDDSEKPAEKDSASNESAFETDAELLVPRKTYTTPQGKEAALYDFAHPLHRLNESFPGLETIEGKLAGLAAEWIEKNLHVDNTIVPVGIQTLRFQDYVAGLNPRSTLYSFDLEPLEGRCLLCVEHAMVQVVVQCFFGGGSGADFNSERKQLSAAESAISERVCEGIYNGLNMVWSEVFDAHVHANGQIHHNDVRDAAAMASVVVLKQYEIETAAGKARFNVLLPYNMLMPLRGKIAGLGNGGEENQRSWAGSMGRRLDDCEVDVNGVLADAHLTVGQLLALKDGDFIPLGGNQKASFLVADTSLFEAEVGVSNGCVSASITHWYHNEKLLKTGGNN